MKKIITPKQTIKERKVVVPSQKTIDFLKQFASTYYVDKSLPVSFNGVFIN